MDRPPGVVKHLCALLLLLSTAAQAVASGIPAVCPMASMRESAAEPGCGHCPPAPSTQVRDALPDCCALHVAAVPASAPFEAAGASTRHGPPVAVLPVQVCTVPAMPAFVRLPLDLDQAAASPLSRNLPLLR